jgi:WD40 repeat protein
LQLSIVAVIQATRATANANEANKQAATAQAASTLATTNQRLAEERASIARAGELATQSQSVRDSQLDLASLLGIEAFNTWDFHRTRAALANNLNANPHLYQYMFKHSGWISAVAFNPKKDELASIGCLQQVDLDCREWGIVLWSVLHGQLRNLTSLHASTTYSLAFNPAGTILATGGCTKMEGSQCLAGEVDLWDMKTNQQMASSIHGLHNDVQSLAFSPNGRFLAIGGCSSADTTVCTEGEILVWDVITQSQVGEPIHRSAPWVNGLVFSPDGQFLASSGIEDGILLWKFKDGQISEPVLSLSSSLESFRSIAFSPDGKTILSGGTDNLLRLWDLTTGQQIREYAGHEDDIYAVAFSPNGDLLASGSLDNTVKLWNKDSGTIIETFRGHSTDITSVAFSPDGKYLVSASTDGRMIVWNVEDDLPLADRRLMADGNVINASIRSDGTIITTNFLGDAIVVSTDNGRTPIGKFLEKDLFANLSSFKLALSSDYELLALGSDGVIYLSNLRSGHAILDKPITHQEGWVTSVAFSPDKTILASGGCYHRREDGICPSGIIYLWDTKTGEEIGDPMIGHTSWINGLAFSPDGKMLASASTDDTILLWDLSNRKVVGIPFVGHKIEVLSVSFSPDGKMLASGAKDGRIILWDVQTHQLITVLNEDKGLFLPIHNVAFSPDGNYLVSSDYDGNVMTWVVNPDRWKQATCQRVGRNFTQKEWAFYFPGEVYRLTCPQWPAGP